MEFSFFEQALVDVWRQALVDNATTVELGGRRYPVRNTPRKGLWQVHRAQKVRVGKKVM